MVNDAPRGYPRTLQQAFGPYTSNEIQEPVRPFDTADVIVMVGCAAAALFFVVEMLLWG